MKFKKYDGSTIIEGIQFTGNKESISKLQEFGGFTTDQCKLFQQVSDGKIGILLGFGQNTNNQFFVLKEKDWLVKMDSTMVILSDSIITNFYTKIED